MIVLRAERRAAYDAGAALDMALAGTPHHPADAMALILLDELGQEHESEESMVAAWDELRVAAWDALTRAVAADDVNLPEPLSGALSEGG